MCEDREICKVPLSCHANAARSSIIYSWVQRQPSVFYLCRNALIVWEPNQDFIHQKNVVVCLLLIDGIASLCLQMAQKKSEKKAITYQFTLRTQDFCYTMHLVPFPLKQADGANTYAFSHIQGHRFGFLWRLLPFETNKRKWSCSFAHSVTSQPLNSPLKMIPPKVSHHVFFCLFQSVLFHFRVIKAEKKETHFHPHLHITWTNEIYEIIFSHWVADGIDLKLFMQT